MKAEMKKVYLLAHSSDREALMQGLQNFGKMQISDIKETTEGEEILKIFPPEEFESSYDPRLSQIHHMIGFLQSFEERKPDPIETFVTLKRPVLLDEKTWGDHAEKGLDNLENIAKEVHALEEHLTNIKSARMRLDELKLELGKIKDLDISLDELGETEKTKVVLGRFKPADFEAFEKKAENIGIKKLASTERDVSVLLIYFKDTESLLEESGFSEIILPDLLDLEGTPRQMLEQIEKRLADFVKEEAEIKSEALKIFSKWKMELFSAHDHLSLIYQQKENAKRAASSRKTLFLRGWCRSEDVPELEKTANNATDGTVVFISKEPEEGDSPPVLLVNDSKMTPFEIVTRTFSLPSYSGLDPTPYLAPFFFIFTGICLTDAAYGIALAVMGYFFAKRYEQLRNFFTLLMYIGISTAIIGALIGGWMGGLIPIKPLIFDSLSDPITFLVLSLALGVVHLIFGIIIKMYENISKKKLIDALFDQGFWLGLLLSIIVYGLVSVGTLPSYLGAISSYSGILFAVGLVLTQGRQEKNIVKRFFFGLISLYGLINYLADVLSYSRLLALGLATGVIGLVLNQIAGMTLEIPIIGVFVALIVLIGGHLFNLAISIMSAYIHSSRLQYVEFFSKFFEGGGRAFVPFKQKMDYVNIKEV